MGRPALINATNTAAILEAVRAGSFLADAAALAGLDSRLVREWARRGKQQLLEHEGNPKKVPKAERKFAQFRLDLEQARAEADVDSIKAIGKRGRIDCDWKAEAWLMTRRNRAKWDPSVREVVAQEIESLCDIVRETLGEQAWAKVVAAIEDSGIEAAPGYGEQSFT